MVNKFRICTALATVAAATLLFEKAPARPTAPAAVPTQEAAEGARPNVLFLLIDDMGYADLSITGNTLIETPNIDRLAREGVLMTQFYDAAPICSPSRAGFFTGEFPAENSFVNYIHGTRPDARTGQADWLDPKLPNIARALHGAGYATAHFGKWHMGGTRDITESPPATAYGFDVAFTNNGGGPNGSSPAARIPKSEASAIYIDKTLDFVRHHKDSPWYVQLWTNDVHEPWKPSADQIAAIDGAGRNPLETKYFATVVALDKQVGRLTEALDKMGELDDTLLIITSDNGPTARRRFYRNGKTPPGSTYPFRGRKNSLYEGGTRQPLIVRWPGHVVAGTRDNTTVAQAVDLYPTLAAITGIPTPENVDGIDIEQAWQGTPITERPDLFWTYGAYGPYGAWTRAGNPHDRSPSFAIRSGDWKLLAEGDGSNAELYNIVSDPSETTNVAKDRPDIVKSLMTRLLAWSHSLPNKPSLAQPGEGRDHKRRSRRRSNR